MKRMVDEKEVVKDIEAVEGGIKVLQLDGTSKTIPVSGGGKPTVDDFTAGPGIVIDEDLTHETVSIEVDQESIPFKVDLATVAFSGDYDDLTNKPVIPTQLTAGDDIIITNNEISTVYGGSKVLTDISTSEYTEGIAFSRRSGAYFQTYDSPFSNDIKRLEVISQAQPGNTPASFKITMSYTDAQTSEQITLLDGTYSGIWNLAEEQFEFNNTTEDPVSGQDVIDIAFCRTASGGLFNIRFITNPAFSSATVSDFKLTITAPEITPINDDFISSNIARVSQIPTVVNDIVLTSSNALKTIYGGLPETTVVYQPETFTNIDTFTATGSASQQNNFRAITNSNVVSAMYNVDNNVYQEWLTKAKATTGNQMWYKLTYSISLIDLTDNIRYTVESRSDVNVYFNNSQDFVPFEEGYFLRTYYYRATSSDVRFGVLDPSTGSTISMADLITILNARDSRNYDLNSMQFDTFKIDVNIFIPPFPIDNDYIPVDNNTIVRDAGVIKATQQVSGTNDGTNWTSLTIMGDTYGIPSGGGSAITIVDTAGSESISDGTATLNVMTRDTEQDITGKKVFAYNKLYLSPETQYGFYPQITINERNMNVGGLNIYSNYGNTVQQRAALSWGNGKISLAGRNTALDLGNYDGYASSGIGNIYAEGGDYRFKNLPTTDPQVDGQLWNDNGTLKISSGN